MNLDHYIAALLKDHDCVIVPDFGGFVANYAPARINPVNHRFDPPHRKVTFNKLLTHNDGLLASYVARMEEEEYERGLKLVQEYALFLKAELKDKKRVKLNRVGVLSMSQDRAIRFEQFDNADFYSDGTGLESFFARRIERKAPASSAGIKPASAPAPEEPKVIPITKPEREKAVETPIAEEVKEKKGFPFLKVAAAAALIPLAGYIAWLSAFTPVLRDSKSFHYSDLNPFSEKVCIVYHPRTERIEMPDRAGFDNLLEQESEAYITLARAHAPDKTLVVRKTESPRVPRAVEVRYHVIGGCFSVRENAEGLVRKYLAYGHRAGIVDQKGTLYRVSIASFATRREAKQALEVLQSDIPGAWLLRK